MQTVTEPEDPKSAPPADGAAPAEPTAAAEPAAAAEAPNLKPAQPEPEELAERPTYMPKVPWGIVIALVASIGTAYWFYTSREAERADGLRRQLLETRETQLATMAERYQALRTRIERWTMDAAAAGEPEQHVDPRLRIAGLHDGHGLYLRIRASDASSPEAIARGAMAMEQDAITRCLGIAPDSARGIYERGEFLMPSWVDEVQSEHDPLRLRVIDEQLARHVTADVPVVSTLLEAQYFLLVLQQGENRRDAPVDVFLWDMREERQLLAARVQADGVLLPVRIRSMVPEAPEAPRPDVAPSTGSGGAHDCSIASQIKALTGDAPVAVSSPIPDPAAAPSGEPTPAGDTPAPPASAAPPSSPAPPASTAPPPSAAPEAPLPSDLGAES
jgi:hypothetical protein